MVGVNIINLQQKLRIFSKDEKQKGVDNPERFLAQGVGVNENQSEALLQAVRQGGAGVNEGVNEGVNGEQLSAGNPEGSEGIINPALIAAQPQQETGINNLQGHPQEQISNEPQTEPSAELTNQGHNLDIESLLKLIPVITKIKKAGKGNFSKVLSNALRK